MQVRDIMATTPRWIDPDTKLTDAATRMRDENVGALPVGDGRKLIGMLTDRDIVVRLLPDGLSPDAKVSDAMSSDVLYCFEDQPVDEVAKNMGDEQVRRLPVMNRDKELVGMISLGDIAAKAAKEVAGEALGHVSTDRKVA